MAEHDVVDLHAGQRVWYMKPGTGTPLPATMLSDGICETQRLASGQMKQFAHLAVGTADPTHVLLGHESAPVKPGDRDDLLRAVSQRQTQETTAPWDPDGAPGTWHLDGECPDLVHPAVVEAP